MRPSKSDCEGDFAIQAELFPIDVKLPSQDYYSAVVNWPTAQEEKIEIANQCLFEILGQVCDTEESVGIVNAAFEDLRNGGEAKLVKIHGETCSKYTASLTAMFCGEYPCGGELFLIINNGIAEKERHFKLFEFCNWEVALEAARRLKLTDTSITIFASNTWTTARPNLPAKIELNLDSKYLPTIEARDPALEAIEKDLTDYDLPW